MFCGNIIILVLFCWVSLRDGASIPTNHRKGKLSQVEWNNYNFRESEGHGTYAFGYDIEDQETNNIQYRNEEKLSNGSVVGSYGYLDPDGEVFLVNYIADDKGYRASIEKAVKLTFLKPINIQSDTQNEQYESKEETFGTARKGHIQPIDAQITL